MNAMTDGGSLIAMISIAISLAASISLVFTVSKWQPLPYMDEVFHVRQTLAYMQGNWSYWDEKITTPPGMYILSVTVLKMFALVGVKPSQYVAFHFRLFSAVLSTVNYVLIALIIRRRTGSSRLPLALCLTYHPVLFFFSFLYYTDQCSLTFVFLSLYCSLTRQPCLSAFCCAMAVTVRQTNVVWLLLVACPYVSQVFSVTLFKPNERASIYSWSVKLCNSFGRRPKVFLKATFLSVLASVWHILVLALFILFIHYNGGIVLGDRKAHRAVINVPQLWYFVAFCCFSAPLGFALFLFRTVSSCRRSLNKTENRVFTSFVTFVFLSFVIAGSLIVFDYAHPYLLADNRHYTFHLWRKLIHPSPLAYVSMAPFYALCTMFVLDRLLNGATVLNLVDLFSIASVIVGTVFTLAPASLLEPRYFLIPYILWRIFSHQYCVWEQLVEFVWNITILVVTIYVFVYRPFHWSNDPHTLQRFMW